MDNDKNMEQFSHEGQLVAVIVGIDGYKDLRSLHCAVNDAVSLTETFKKVWPGCEITTLVWPQMEKSRQQEKGWGIRLPEDASDVTRQNILASVRHCVARCGEKDTFIFYFSGHGEFIGDEPALITVGCGKTAAGTDYIKLRDIQKAAAAGKCKKKVMILDCCQGVEDRAAPPKGYKKLRDLSQDWWIYLSCSPGERSLEDQYEGKISDGYLQQGVFTARLVEGLRGEIGTSENGITLLQLAAYVGKWVPIDYQEKLRTLILRGEKSALHLQDKTSQNPMLIGEGFAVSGPYHVLMAPHQVPLFHKSRKKRPGDFFFQHWWQYLFGKWPLLFPYKPGFLVGGALLYAVVMFLTVIWHSAQVEPTFPFVLFGTAVGLGSALTWWSSVSFAVTVNEHRWFVGGYGTLLFYLAWHGIVVIWFWWIFGLEIHPLSGTAKIYYLMSDLFLLFIVIVIYGCNASQTIIAIAEPLRRENERSDIRQAIRVFQEFKVKTFRVSLYNYIPMVSARPVFYYWVFGGALIIVVVSISCVIFTVGAEGLNPWMVFIFRNLLVLALMAWSMIWYAAAFTYLQKEVYKR